MVLNFDSTWKILICFQVFFLCYLEKFFWKVLSKYIWYSQKKKKKKAAVTSFQCILIFCCKYDKAYFEYDLHSMSGNRSVSLMLYNVLNQLTMYYPKNKTESSLFQRQKYKQQFYINNNFPCIPTDLWLFLDLFPE